MFDASPLLFAGGESATLERLCRDSDSSAECRSHAGCEAGNAVGLRSRVGSPPPGSAYPDEMQCGGHRQIRARFSVLGVGMPMRYSSVMPSRSSEQLEHLAQELAQLTREDRAKVLANAARLGG